MPAELHRSTRNASSALTCSTSPRNSSTVFTSTGSVQASWGRRCAACTEQRRRVPEGGIVLQSAALTRSAPKGFKHKVSLSRKGIIAFGCGMGDFSFINVWVFYLTSHKSSNRFRPASTAFFSRNFFIFDQGVLSIICGMGRDSASSK
jgi:hypothetical protein